MKPVRLLAFCLLLAACDDNGPPEPLRGLMTAANTWQLATATVPADIPPARAAWSESGFPLRSNTIWPDSAAAQWLAEVLVIDHVPMTLQTLEGPQSLPESWSSIANRMDVSQWGYGFGGMLLTVRLTADGVPGRIVVDIGDFNEDVLRNGYLDTEDINHDRMLHWSEDVGLDYMAGGDPPWPLPEELLVWTGNSLEAPYDFMDLNGNGYRDLGEHWSYDDYRERATDDSTSTTPLANPSGMEGNGNTPSLAFPDSEDLNDNRSLDTHNNFWRFVFPVNGDVAQTFGESRSSGTEGWMVLHCTLGLADDSWLDQERRLDGYRLRIGLTGFVEPVRLELAAVHPQFYVIY